MKFSIVSRRFLIICALIGLEDIISAIGLFPSNVLYTSEFNSFVVWVVHWEAEPSYGCRREVLPVTSSELESSRKLC